MSSTPLGLLVAIIFAINLHEAISSPRRWCYFTNWAQYRRFPAGFTPREIDASMCTHISYAFAGIKDGKLSPFERNDDDSHWSKGMYSQVNDLKLKNPGLKTLLAVGGWSLGSMPFSYAVAAKHTRQVFVTTTIKFLRDRHFDGLDICWQYPTLRGSPPEDRHNLAELLKDLRKAFDEESATSGQRKLLLGIVIGFEQNLISRAYEIDAIKTSADTVTVLSYDFYTPGNTSQYVMHTSALYPGNFTDSFNGPRNVEKTARYLAFLGIPKHRINIGISLSARTYRLQNNNSNEEGAVSAGEGDSGPYTQIHGHLAYFEICELQKKGGKTVFMPGRGVPYMVYEDQWISFENAESVKLKADFAVREGFGGVMIWSFDMDDFPGICPGGQKYPLLRSIYEATKKNVIYTTTKKVWVNKTTTNNTTVSVEATMPSSTYPDMTDEEWIHYLCEKKESGIFPHRNSCKSFIVCIDGTGFVSHCTKGQHWDKKTERCMEASLAKCP